MADRASSSSFAQRVLLVATTVVLALLLARLADVLVLVFGSIVLACAMSAAARLLQRGLHCSRKLAVPLALAAVAALLALAGWLVGDSIGRQMEELRQRVPQALASARQVMENDPLGRQFVDLLRDLPGQVDAVRLASMMNATLGALGSLLLMLVVAVYLALSPGTYVDGLVRLVPPSHRAAARSALDAAGHALTRWLLGQGISMLFLGGATTLGLLALGAPLPLALGLITGLLAFVPLIGALVAGALSVLAAFTAGPSMALYVLLLFVVLQQAEEYLLLPFVQRWAVALPPALTLLAAVVFGVLFGPLGLVFATPLMVVCVVMTKRLYVRGVLEQPQPANAPAEAGRPAGRADAAPSVS